MATPKTKPKEKWHLASRRSAHVKVTNLWLYPELDCSSCVDDIYPASGDEELQYYCDFVRRHRPDWWNADAVPIYWSVVGDGDGFGCEQAPFSSLGGDNVLTYYYPPVNIRTGEPVNWYQLPVVNTRFPKFAAALGWLPAPGQLFAPLRSIVSGVPQPPRNTAAAEPALEDVD